MASTTALPRAHGARTSKSRDKKPAGFHQSWYAIARSDEVRAGEVIGRDFLDGRAIAYRGENGQAVVMNAYCRHLGADLSMGKVFGNDIRCAFHHWQYGPDGACTKIPASEKIPKAAKMFKYPTVEKWGLIWAFNGAKPLFDVPEFVDYVEPDLDLRTAEAFDLPVEPWVPFTNSMDFQHLRVLHGLKIECDPDAIDVGDYRIQYDVRFEDPNLGVFDQRIRVTGTNTIALAGRLNGMAILSMATGTPTPDGRTHGWSVTATPKAEGSDAEREQRLQIGEAFFKRLIDEDTPIMQTIRFHDGLLIDADRALARFLQYVRRFPTARPAAD
ncbi:MAG TPA: Rieske (2Fe-2S) protein [Candidatus Binatus sp.]|nr:Rieske (2Fe-2S) protein [Candidatus Binatus sp.]